jgi:hypothetical protein
MFSHVHTSFDISPCIEKHNDYFLDHHNPKCIWSHGKYYIGGCFRQMLVLLFQLCCLFVHLARHFHSLGISTHKKRRNGVDWPFDDE